MKTYILLADIVNGVLHDDRILLEEADQVLDENDFYSSLKDLKDGVCIASVVSKEMFDKIQEQYGIH